MSSPSQPPPGGNQSQTKALMGVTIAMLSFSTIFVSLRFLIRIYVVKSVWWDDWTTLFALLGTAVGAGLDIVEFHYGYGHHRYYIDGPAYGRILYYSYGEWIQTFATLMWTKISICFFLSRIPATKVSRTPLFIAIIGLFISNLILTLLWILQCIPVQATWDLAISGKCFTKSQLLEIILAQGIISAISDFTLAAYPILKLARVQISLRKRIGLCLLMGLGIITGACCIIRNVLNWTNESTDSTWSSVPNWMWRTMEVNFGIAAACLPSICPGYSEVRRRFAKRQNYYFSTDQIQTQSGKARKWLNADHTTRDTTNATTSAARNAADPNILIPEAAILMSTDIHMQRRASSKYSAEELMEGADPAARWESWGGSGSKEHEARSVGHSKASIGINSLVYLLRNTDLSEMSSTARRRKTMRE